MGSSPHFVSTPCHQRHKVSLRPFRLAFATAPAVTALTWQQRSNSPAHSPKGTPSHLALPAPPKGADLRTSRSTSRRREPQSIGIKRRHSAPTACRHTVSGSISLPSPGNFSPFPHGTCALSVAREYLALGGGPPCFPQDFPCPVVLKVTGRSLIRFRLRDYHPLWFLFPVGFG